MADWVYDIFKTYDDTKAAVTTAAEKACKDAVTKKILSYFNFPTAFPFIFFVAEIGIVYLIARKFK